MPGNPREELDQDLKDEQANGSDSFQDRVIRILVQILRELKKLNEKGSAP